MTSGALRVLQVATLVSDDGAYGGPVRVAQNQADELRRGGHDVTLAAGSPSPTSARAHRSSAASLFRARTVIPGSGFAGLAAPGMLPWLVRHVRDYDVVHVHVARDLVTLPAALIALLRGVPVVLQPHGMIDPSAKLLSRPLDALLTRPVLRRAQRVLHLTPTEHDGLVEVGGSGLALASLHNGVPAPTTQRSTSTVPEVLYLARMHPRKRPGAFVEMAKQLLSSGRSARFALVGPDEGAAPSPADLDVDGLAWEGAIPPETTQARMARASIYVLPSVDEPYPMSVLEAMALGVPVVITDTCGLADLVRRSGCGIVVDDSVQALTAAVARLLDEPEAASTMGEAGATVARDELGMDAVADQLEAIYRRAISDRAAVTA